MSNLSYCRFQNTLEDLRDCEENLQDKVESKEENAARARLIKMCHDIAETVPLEEIKWLPVEA